MRPLWRAVLKVVVMATTMCSGVKLARCMTRQWGIRATKENGILDNSYRTWTAQPKVPGFEI